MDDGAAIGLEQDLLAAAVGLVLPHRVVGALAGKVVLQFHGNHGNAVQEQNHIHGIERIVGAGSVSQLANDFEAVCFELIFQRGVARGRWFEIAQLEAGVRRHLETVAQNIEQPVALAVGFQQVAHPLEKRLFRFGAVELLDLRPFFGLRLFDEADEGARFQSQFAVVVFLAYRPTALVARSQRLFTLATKRLPACLFQAQLDIRFEAPLRGVEFDHFVIPLVVGNARIK